MANVVNKKTIFFEDYYNTNIKNFNTTTEINDFIEEKLNKKLKIIKINTNIL